MVDTSSEREGEGCPHDLLDWHMGWDELTFSKEVDSCSISTNIKVIRQTLTCVDGKCVLTVI